MDVLEALEARMSVRAFLDREVPREMVEKILLAAGHAPSGVNTQPWKVFVLSGTAKTELCTRLENAFRAGNKGQPEYAYYPDEWVEPYRSRRKDCGLRMYSALGIERGDRQRQMDQWAANYRAFDAPVMLLFFIDKRMQQGSFLDYGMFLQSLMLAAVNEGLATCPQASLAEYPALVREYLGLEEGKMLLAGMALGFADTQAVVNSYRTPRVGLDDFVHFLDE
ncbi:MAG: nitroreductase [bacterium]